MLKEQTITIASIELDGSVLTMTGVLDEWAYDWRVELSFPNAGIFINSRVWTREDYICDEDELHEAMWEEVMFITKKYHTIIISEEKEMVEVEDEEEEEA